MGEVIRHIRSVCPVCLQNLPAALIKEMDGQIILEKSCPRHGTFSVPVWRGAVDFASWTKGAEPLGEGEGFCCPDGCAGCTEHTSDTCCTLLEVTKRCNLRCRFCFADGAPEASDPGEAEVREMIREIGQRRPGTMLQLSGGEPTLRDDLPALTAFAKTVGCAYVQVNTNGIRLAEDKEYVRALARAGLDIVFLQFDGIRDEIYQTLRGRALLETKRKAIENCAAENIGVTLVPTVVPGVNTEELGNIVRLAASLAPGVRGVHFQPVSYFGRCPEAPDRGERYTLDELMADISVQTGLPVSSFLPSRCDHPLCGFHANFLIGRDGALSPLSAVTHTPNGRSCAVENREYIARHWRRQPQQHEPPSDFSEQMDFDTFLYYLHQSSLTLSAMAFQDAMNLNVERLRACSLHVYENGTIRPFCAKYLSAVAEE